jgi:2-oxo-3-hexenedioate decarboxylase
MTPQTLLSHYDTVQPWPGAFAAEGDALAQAYQSALAVRALRVARGEEPRGYKVGFTNRTIWQRYQVFAPIWGTVWNTTLSEGTQPIAAQKFCEPRLEPEVVFGMRATPPANATLQELFESVAWVAPGFEVVQSHRPDWKFTAPDTVADGGLHGHLRLGTQLPLHDIATDAQAFAQRLANAQVRLLKNGELVEQGQGANVLDSPLHALHHFMQTLRSCPAAPDLKAGDVITTGTWTDAYAVAAGETWTAQFDAPLGALSLSFT